MARNDLKLTGSKATQAALADFPKRFANKAVRQSLRDAMKNVVLRDYKRIAPKGQTKKLSKAAKVRAAKGRRGKRLPRGTIGIALVIRNLRYASFRLLGTKFSKGSASLRQAFLGNKSVLKIWFEGQLRRKIPQIAEEVRRATKSKG